MNELKLNLAFLREFKKDYRPFISGLIAEYGHAFVAKSPVTNLHFFSDPKFIEHVLFEKHSVYVRPPNKIVDAIVGDSAMRLKSDQEQWRNERFNVLNPILIEQNVLRHANHIIDSTAEQLDTWDKYGKNPVSIHDLISSVTIRNLCDLLFDKIKIDDMHLAHLIREFFYLFVANESSVTKLSWKLPTKTLRRTNTVIRELKQLCNEIVEFCLSDKASGNNLIRTLAAKYSPNYPNLTQSDKQHLAGRTAIFLIGGFDNITGNLIWTLIHLSWYPLIAKNVYEEVKNKIGANKLQPNDINSLSYTRAAIMESLRLTSGSFLPRMAMEDDRIGDYLVKKYDRVLLQIYYLHHSAEYWDNPEGFKPERFLKPLSDKYRFIYIPFSAGPRGCIGKDFSMVQTVILLSMIMQKHRIYLAPNQIIDPNFQYVDPERSKSIKVIIDKAHDYL